MVMKKALRRLWDGTIGRLDGQYERELNQIVGSACGSLLDVGCGFNSPVRHLIHRPARLVGVDGWAPVIEQSRAKGIHDEYHVLPLGQIETRFGPDAFDTVLASDIVEHFTADDGMALIAQMERVARRTIIIYTPNGFLPQGEEYGNPLQRHRSGWTVKQMRAMGYRVTGVEGIKCLRGELAHIRWYPAVFWWAVSLLSQPLVRNWPRMAFRILCVKTKAG
jgi:SAM-dependent methyltransferase